METRTSDRIPAQNCKISARLPPPLVLSWSSLSNHGRPRPERCSIALDAEFVDPRSNPESLFFWVLTMRFLRIQLRPKQHISCGKKRQHVVPIADGISKQNRDQLPSGGGKPRSGSLVQLGGRWQHRCANFQDRFSWCCAVKCWNPCPIDFRITKAKREDERMKKHRADCHLLQHCCKLKRTRSKTNFGEPASRGLVWVRSSHAGLDQSHVKPAIGAFWDLEQQKNALEQQKNALYYKLPQLSSPFKLCCWRCWVSQSQPGIATSSYPINPMHKLRPKKQKKKRHVMVTSATHHKDASVRPGQFHRPAWWQICFLEASSILREDHALHPYAPILRMAETTRLCRFRGFNTLFSSNTEGWDWQTFCPCGPLSTEEWICLRQTRAFLDTSGNTVTTKAPSPQIDNLQAKAAHERNGWPHSVDG